MDSEEISIVGVEVDTDCVCLSGKNKSGCVAVRAEKSKKGKEPANLCKPLSRKRSMKQRDEGSDVIILSVSKQQRNFKPDCSDFDCIMPPIDVTTDGSSHQSKNPCRINSNSSLVTPSSSSVCAFSSNPVVFPDDEALAVELQAQELACADSATIKQIHSDEELAKQLMLSDNKDKETIQESPVPAPGPITLSKALSGLDRLPTCWTACPKCLPTDKRRYHLIEVILGSSEWQVVSDPLIKANFTVHKVQRIQNESLWQRLMFEKNLMLRDREDVNMQLLYHTTRAQAPVICEEGLDLRLSRNGRFGNGIYFSDDPAKCNSYWPQSRAEKRQMFVCRVLLGDIKEYRDNECNSKLVREPLKECPKPGGPKTYDSVKGRIYGQNEFVVYNAYRVMPEYLLEYSLQTVNIAPPLSALQQMVFANQQKKNQMQGLAGHHRRRSHKRKS